MDKTAIKKFSVWARTKLISDIIYRAGLLGVSEEGIAKPLPQSTKDVQFFDIGTASYAQVNGKEIAQRSSLVAAIKTKQGDGDYKAAFKFIVEEIAYTWFNRLTAIRFMEVNEYLPVRVLSSIMEGKNEPDLVTAPHDSDLDFSDTEAEEILRLKDENKLDELFRMLFIKQCNALNAVLPRLFEKTNDYSELLLNVTFTDSEGLVYKLTHDIAEEDWQDQVQIIGWLYQYYISEKKDEVFTALKKNVKISKENIPVATQLFTPDWIVRYMVENSLGRLWVEGHPNAELKANWKYYLEEAEQEEEVQKQLEVIRKEYAELSPEDIKIIDPCCGSGHILAYIFDVLMQIYTSCGYSAKNAVKSILQNNLYALDIDERAAQLAYFAVMMKACEYDRRFFTRKLQPKVYAIAESNGVTEEQLEYFGSSLDELNRNVALTQMQGLLAQLHDAKEYGSIINVDTYDWGLLRSFVAEFDYSQGYNIFATHDIDKVQQKLQKLVEVGEILAQKYHVVVTNPPYASFKGLNSILRNYLVDNYLYGKYDLFGAFVSRCINFACNNGNIALITPVSLLYNPSFKILRSDMINDTIISSLIELGNDAFEVGFGTATFSLKKIRIYEYNAKYFDVSNKINKDSFSNTKMYLSKIKYFQEFDETKMMYKLNHSYRSILKRSLAISDIGNPRMGMQTNDNNRFLRIWHEVNFKKFSSKHIKGESFGEYKWFPIVKGGGYRKWFGNINSVVNWQYDGYEIKELNRNAAGGRIVGEEFYFCEGITWTHTTYTQPFSTRFMPEGTMINVEGPAIFSLGPKQNYILGCLNSIVAKDIFEKVVSSIHFSASELGKFPLLFSENSHINTLVELNISLSRTDWDSFETSWDFKKHPLV